MKLLLIVLTYILLAAFIIPVLSKTVSGLPKRSARLWWQYFFTALLAAAIVWLGEDPVYCWYAHWIFLVGAANACSCYAFWRAIDISQSKNAVLAPSTHLVAILLSIAFLGEWQLLNPLIVVGVVFTTAGTVLLAMQERSSKLGTSDIQRLLKWAAVYSLIWGGEIFFMKICADDGLQTGTFLLWYYCGSFAGAAVLSALLREGVREISATGIAGMCLLATTIIACTYLVYWSYQLAPVVLVQPLYQISGLLGSLGSGLYIFREHKEFQRIGWYGVSTGTCGAILIIVALAH